MKNKRKKVIYKLLDNEISELSRFKEYSFIPLGRVLKEMKDSEAFKTKNYRNLKVYIREEKDNLSTQSANEMVAIIRDFEDYLNQGAELLLAMTGWTKARTIKRHKEKFSEALENDLLKIQEVFACGTFLSNQDLNKLFDSYEGMELWLRIFFKVYPSDLKVEESSLQEMLMEASQIILERVASSWDGCSFDGLEEQITKTRENMRYGADREHAEEHYRKLRKLETSMDWLMSNLRTIPYYDQGPELTREFTNYILQQLTFKQDRALKQNANKVVQMMATFGGTSGKVLAYLPFGLDVITDYEIKGRDTLAKIAGVERSDVESWLGLELFDYDFEPSNQELKYLFPIKAVRIGLYLENASEEMDRLDAIKLTRKVSSIEEDLPLIYPYIKIMLRCYSLDEVTIDETRSGLIELTSESEEDQEDERQDTSFPKLWQKALDFFNGGDNPST